MTNKILSDHSKRGKVLKPPMLGLGIFLETSWLDLQVPEFIWILLLIEKYGPNEGARIAIHLGKIAEPIISRKNPNSPIGPMILSPYALLTIEEQTTIRAQLEIIKILDLIQLALKDFFLLYSHSPIHFLKKENLEFSDQVNVNIYKIVLSKILDRLSFESTIVLATVCNFLLTMERLFVTKKSNLPGLAEILNYPQTEDSKRLAAFLRNAIKPCFREGYDFNNHWVKYFWNNNLSLEPCLV